MQQHSLKRVVLPSRCPEGNSGLSDLRNTAQIQGTSYGTYVFCKTDPTHTKLRSTRGLFFDPRSEARQLEMGKRSQRHIPAHFAFRRSSAVFRTFLRTVCFAFLRYRAESSAQKETFTPACGDCLGTAGGGGILLLAASNCGGGALTSNPWSSPGPAARPWSSGGPRWTRGP